MIVPVTSCFGFASSACAEGASSEAASAPAIESVMIFFIVSLLTDRVGEGRVEALVLGACVHANDRVGRALGDDALLAALSARLEVDGDRGPAVDGVVRSLFG